MDQLSTAAFELRASAAEARLAALEARLGGGQSSCWLAQLEYDQL